MSHANSPEQAPDAQGHHWERQKHNEHIVAVNGLANELKATREESSESEKKKTRRERVTIGLVALTLIATGVGDFIFWRTLKDAREATRRAHIDSIVALNLAHVDSSNALAGANQSSAMQHNDTIQALNRASDANIISRDSAVKERRPYLVISSRDAEGKSFNQIMPGLTLNDPPMGSVWIKNVGKTPGLTVRTTGGFSVYDSHVRSDLNPKLTEKLLGESEIVSVEEPIWSNVHMATAISHSDALNIVADKKTIILSFTITYRDDTGAQHTTAACYWFPYIGVGNFCRGHNYAN